ncbi:MAG: TetR-like C-terminal domain-containing protein [Eubacteriales bacterium]|nr:TetR-like C-terminal domain-containing protein [Eubacteriales bacterium]
MDRRVKYTKMVLNDSLLKFLREKPLEKIRVTEICKDAEVNRSTFYAHFDDPFDQFNKLKSELLMELTSFVRQIDTKQLPEKQRQYMILKKILRYVEEKRHIFQALLEKNGDYNMQHDLLVFLGEKVFSVNLESGEGELKDQYHLIYASNGCFGMFYHWLMEDNPALSSDELAHLMADFTRNVGF